ncbi:MAG TPA: helix-turn-helix transcriptional regulator [Ureibacillus sp.]|nr:helix-turn-helix transcriptional regulator [Ureibacillus sp.]
MDRKIEIKLYQLLLDNKMTYQELSNKSGLSVRTISELVNNKTERIPKTALCKIADALNIEDIRDLIDFKVDK